MPKEIKEVELWLRKAEKDLLAAEINYQEGLYEVLAFLSHQAAEKALKALYILKFKKLWKIHDLEKLAKDIDANIKIRKIAARLNPHYIATRYPTDIVYSKEIAEKCLKDSRVIVEWVKKQMKKLKQK